MSFFDVADRGALTLTLSRNDPFDADFLTPEGVPLYRVRTHKRHLEAGITTGFGYLDAEVTSILRVRSDLPSISTSSSAQTIENLKSESTLRPRASSGVSGGSYRRHSTRRASRRSTRTSSILSTPLDTIDEVADADADADAGGEGDVDADYSDSTGTGDEREREDSDMMIVATIERRPLSLSPVRLRFNGKEGPANKYLRRERPFSSTRCFLSITGDLLKWQLSTPTPKLYNTNKTRISKYCRPFLPSNGLLSPRTAVLEIAEGVESDRALDEIVVTLLLTFLL